MASKKLQAEINYKNKKAKADALLVASNALFLEFPSRSRDLSRLCISWRIKQKKAYKQFLEV